MKNLLLFVGGVATGVGVTYLYLKKKTEDDIQQAWDESNEYWKSKYYENSNTDNTEEDESVNDDTANSDDETMTPAKAAMNKPDLDVVEKIIQKQNYAAMSKNKPDSKKHKKEGKAMTAKAPYPIDQDTYDDSFDFVKEELVYYDEDEVLANHGDGVVPIDDTIGQDNLDYFDEIGEETIYIRNENAKTDYEVTRIFGSYENIAGRYDDEEDDE